MQNKPNLLNVQIYINIYETKIYKNKTASGSGKNKPNSNPIKANFRKAKMNANVFVTKDYRKNDAFAVRKNKPNSNPISERPKTNATLFTAKDYENKPLRRRGKNKPKQTQFQTQRLSKLFLAFTFLCPNYNLAMQTLDDTVEVCLKFMKDYKVRHVPIIEIPTEKDGKPYFVGIVSQRDLFRQISPYVGKIGEEKTDLKAMRQTLGQVVTRNPKSVSPQTPIPDMITFMVEDSIDMVPVLDDGDMVGIVTSADIVKLFVRLDAIRQLHVKAGKVEGTPQGGNPKNKQLLDLLSGGSDEMADVLSSVLRTVEDVMTEQVVWLEEQDNLAKAMDVMQEGKFRHVLIVDKEGRLTGIISDRDILRYLPMRSRQGMIQGARSAGTRAEVFRSNLFDVAPEDASLGLPVKNIMSQEIVHVLPTCSFYDAVKMLHEMKISCLPVVDDEKKIRGIVTATDVMRGLLAAYKLTAKSEV